MTTATHVYADDVWDSVLIKIPHPANGRRWRVVKPNDVVGFWHLESSVVISREYSQRYDDVRIITQFFSLVLHESQFSREAR